MILNLIPDLDLMAAKELPEVTFEELLNADVEDLPLRTERMHFFLELKLLHHSLKK